MLLSPSSALCLLPSTQSLLQMNQWRWQWLWGPVVLCGFEGGRKSESVCIYVLNVILYLQPTAVVLISDGMHYRLKSCANEFP